MTSLRTAALGALLLFACANPVIAQTPTSKQKPRPKAAAKAPPAAPTKAAAPRPAPPPPSVVVTTNYRAGDEAILTTVQSSGVRQRFEFAKGPTLIVQCDTKKAIQVSELTRSYAVSALDDVAAAAPAAADAAKGGPVVLKTVITDTGERKEMYGLPARRVTTVTTREPSSSACDKSRTRSETDGWYADLPVAMQCGAAQPPVGAGDRAECADALSVERIGPVAALGYPLSYTTTTTDGGKVLSTVSMETTVLAMPPADPAKYEVPAGYTQLKDAQELSRAEQAARAEQPKGRGVTRIGIVLPQGGSDAAIPPEAIGNELLEALAIQAHEPVALDATEPAAIDAEAKRKACDYVLFTELVAAKTSTPGKIGGMFKKVSRSDAKENHEARVHYRLVAPGSSTPVIDKTATAKTGPGFDMRSVLTVARLAARVYFGMSAGVMQALLANTGGGGGAADPTMNALNMIMTLGTKPAPPADTLEAVVAEALQRQSADVLKAIAKRQDDGTQAGSRH